MNQRLFLPILLVTLSALPAGAVELLKPVGGRGSGPTVDGLQATIRAVKEDFGPGESILIHWRLSNKDEAQKVVRLNQNPRIPAFFSFEIRRDGQVVPTTLKALDTKPVDKVLRGGGQIDLWLDLRALPWTDTKWLNQKGSYEIVVGYVGIPGGKDLPSGKATFRVVAAGTPTFPRLDPALAERIKTLITKLGADDFAEREAAHKELLGIGRKALGPLTEALTNSADPEIRLRCQNLIDQIRRNQQRPHPNDVLCDRCRDRTFTTDIGRCRQCRGNTPSGGWIHCPACARRLNRCAACGRILRVPVPPPPRPPRPIPQPQPQPQPPPAPPPEPVPPPVIPPDDF